MQKGALSKRTKLVVHADWFRGELAGCLSSARALERSHELGFKGRMVIAMLQMRLIGEAVSSGLLDCLEASGWHRSRPSW